MRIRKALSSITCTMATLVVFLLIISIALASAKNSPDNQNCSVSKKNSIPSNSDSQLPYEERETEKDDELQDQTSLVCFLAEPVFLTPLNYQNQCCDKVMDPICAVNDMPLYLSKRVLLI